jgi:hypothetical protein
MSGYPPFRKNKNVVKRKVYFFSFPNFFFPIPWYYLNGGMCAIFFTRSLRRHVGNIYAQIGIALTN